MIIYKYKINEREYIKLNFLYKKIYNILIKIIAFVDLLMKSLFSESLETY